MIDLEYVGNCSSRPSAEDFLVELSIFVGTIEARYGVAPVIYTTRGFYRDYLAGSGVSTGRLWVRDLFGSASWPNDRSALFHQYANNGRLDGIEGPVDLNVFLSSRAEFTSLLRK